MGFELRRCVDKSKEAESSAEKLAAPPGPAAIQASTSKETMDPGKLQTDVGGSDDDDSDEDYVDSEVGETSDDEGSSGIWAKKAKMTTPSKGKNTDEKCSGTGMRSGYVHVATPYTSKLLKKTPSVPDRPKQPAGYACNSCSRTFYSYIALKTHCKVKKHKRSPHK